MAIPITENIVLFGTGVNAFPPLNGAIVTSETHTFANEIVSQTIENGSALTDHIIILPDELEMTLFVSNVDGDSMPLAGENAKTVYYALKSLRNSRTLVSVMTLHELYTNMAIESVSAPHEAPKKGLLIITVKFKKVDITGDFSKRKLSNLQKVDIPGLWDEFWIPSLDYWGEMTDSIANGPFKYTDVSTAAMTPIYWGDVTPANEAVKDKPFWEKIVDTYYEYDTLATDLQTEYDNLLTEIRAGMMYLQSKVIGAQQFIPHLVNNTLQFNLYFSLLGGRWFADIKDSDGVSLLTGVCLTDGCNSIKGTNLKNADGTEVMSGLRMVSTVEGADGTPYAFAPDKNGNTPCQLAITYSATEDAFNELTALVNSPKPLNFLLEDMDYTAA